jgi:FkbM family methyltransferase
VLNPFKPWYVYRPSQLFRRLRCSISPPGSDAAIRLPWGPAIQVDATKSIGKSLARTGVYELATSELLWRLIRPGNRVLDIGANVGYMTALMAQRAGPGGTVFAFEPHPRLFDQLAKNVARLASFNGCARCELFQSAASDREGQVSLACPQAFAANDGVATLESSAMRAEQVIAVEAVMLDRTLNDRGEFTAAKLDVEGHELQVLRGGAELFRNRVRHIVFEDHDGPASPVCELLQQFGFTLLQFGWSLRRLEFASTAQSRLSRRYEAPNFIATKDAGEVLERCRPAGWQVLRG